jgi:TPR repeat protein
MGDGRGQNAFGEWLEDGVGRDADVSIAVHHYKMAVIQGDSDGANNSGLSLEYGKCGVENAKYYRLASDSGDAGFAWSGATE